MKLTRFVASVGAIALVGTVLAAAIPASAAQQHLFINPDVTAQSTDLDITAADVDYTNDGFAFTAYTQNFSPSNGFDMTVYVTPSQVPLLDQPYYLTYQAVVTSNSSTVYETLTQGASKYGPAAVPGAYAIPNAAEHSVKLSVPPISLISTATIFAWASLGDGVSSVNAGVPSPGGILGFGPINIDAVDTLTSLRVSHPSQVYGSTPAVAFIIVSPSTARGTVSVRDGSTEIASFEAAGGDISFNLPTKLAYGSHKLTAVFTASDPALYATSTSGTVSFSVLSPGTKTSTTLLLSKSTQHYKKARAKLTVHVSHKPSGKVVIYDGKKKLKTLTLKKGTASYTVSSKLAKGKHKLHAVFVPKKPLSFAPSTSKTKTLKVVK